MSVLRKVLAAMLLATTLASAQEVPTQNPAEVWVKGRKVDHSWRDGRIWVPTVDLQALLNLGSEMPTMDLLKALEKKGGYLWQVTDGRFEAKQDASLYSHGAPTSARAKNKTHLEYAQAYKEQDAEAAKNHGELTYEVKSFEADTGFVRAFVKVFNEGPGTSDLSTMVCQFQDGFGQTFAVDRRAVPPMDAGEVKEYEIFSLVEKKDTSITVTNSNVAVNFLSDENPGSNPRTAKEARQKARRTKRNKGGLDTKGTFNAIRIPVSPR